MKEIKLTIDGKELRLTDEQLKMLGIATRNNPFDRTSNPCGEYFYTDAFGSVGVGSEEYSDVWKQLGNAANYFNDKNFANQVALHQLLYRKLLKYAYDNGFEDEEWDETKMHAYIIYNFTRKDYDIRWTRSEKEPGTVYFKTPTRATAALNEVVMPFMKEHPDFVW